MSEETKTELKLPSKYKRPSYEAFKAAGYKEHTEEEYVEFFEAHEADLAEKYAAGEVTEENFRPELDDEMTDADGDGLPDVLHVRSQVRAQANRTLRARRPTRHRFKQYLFGNPALRLVRKRVLRLTAVQVRAGLDELLDKEAAGILSVHAPNGQRVDLQALKAGRVELSALPAPAPLVNKPLDSAANDTPSGEHIPQHLGGSFPGDPIAQDVGERLAAEKKAEAEKKGADGDPADATDPLDRPTPGDAPASTELEQPPTGVEGEATAVVDQLPKDSEASVEAATAVDPLASTEEPAAETDQMIEDAVASLQDEAAPAVSEEPKDEAPKGGSKKGGKKGGSK